MSGKKILVTGGAGFIGSHLVDGLLEAGHEVRVLDSLVPQVHGPDRKAPSYFNREAELIVGDVRDKDALSRALDGVEAVFHEASAVGIGQSMYEIEPYVDANSRGTAVLLQLLSEGKHRVERLVVASSMSLYGEGAYSCPSCGPISPGLRPNEQMKRAHWEMLCPSCGSEATPLATPEDKPLQPTSIYAITKRDQEEMSLSVGRAYGIATVALRYFNVYGPRQSLSNPYTGVVAIFSSRLLNDNRPIIYEDGLQSRDFVHVSDIVRANLLALESDRVDYQALNVGTGRSTSLLDLLGTLSRSLGRDTHPDIVGQFRSGDIRHCYADISRASKLLGYAPRVTLEEGLAQLIDWLKSQKPQDSVELAQEQLRKRGLIS